MKRYIVFLLLTAVLSVSVVHAQPRSNDCWDGTVAEAYAGGDGTAANPYQIATPQQLALLAQQTNNGTGGDAYYILTNNICLNDSEQHEWIPIGTEASRFTGVFDGSKFIVSGLFMSYSDGVAGLFGCADHAILRDIRVFDANIHITSLSCEIGLVVGKAINTYIDNCSVSGSAFGTPSSAVRLGGIVGDFIVNIGGNDTISITHCVNNATLSQASDVGGMAGYVSYENGIAMIEGCENNGFMDCYFCAGGMVGEGSVVIRNCHNYGGVVAETCAGGMIGQGKGIVIIKNCVNHESGEITGKVAGGFIGATLYTTISTCANYAPITGMSDNYVFVGGISGSGCAISNCYNRGRVTGVLSNPDPVVLSQIGGITGATANDAMFHNVYNTGEIVRIEGSNVHALYGVIAAATQSIDIFRNCYWFGEYEFRPCGYVIDMGGGADELPESCAFSEGTSPTSWILDEAQYGTTDLLEALNLGAFDECTWIEDLDLSNDGLPIFGNQGIQGFSEPSDSEGISVFPNPASNIIYVELPNETGPTEIELVNVSGQVVARKTFSGKDSWIELGDLPKGMYLLIIRNAEECHTRKVVLN